MATFVDISILQNFSSVFTFILVFVIVYSMLETTKALGADKKSMNAIIAMIVGFLVSMSSGVVAVIQSFTPWFTMLLILIFFILFAVRMFGVSSETITAEITKKSAIVTWILILTAVILLFSLGSGFGQRLWNKARLVAQLLVYRLMRLLCLLIRAVSVRTCIIHYIILKF